MDRVSKIVLLLYYLVFLVEFLSTVFENTEGYLWSLFKVSNSIVIQFATILILNETKRVKLILTSKSSEEYEDRMKNFQKEKIMLFTFFLMSLILSYTRLTINYNFPEVNKSFGSPFAISIIIDLIINIIAQSIILISFYTSFKFFRDSYILSSDHAALTCKLKILTIWVIFLIV